MIRLVQSFQNHLNSIVVALRHNLPINRMQFAWGISVIAVLLPATTYVWLSSTPVASSLSDDALESQAAPLSAVPSITSPIDADLPDSTDGINESASSASTEQSQSQNKVTTQVYINGQEVLLAPNGSVHKEIRTEDSNTSIDISTQSSTSGTSSSRSRTSTNIDFNSSTKSRNSSSD